MKFVIVSVLFAVLACWGVTTAFNLKPDLPKEVLLFNEVGLTKTIPTGVTKVSGHHGNTPAFAFSGKTKNIVSSKKGVTDAARLIGESHDYIVSAYVKVDKKAMYSKNTIMSINSPGGNILYFFLAISSDWQTSRLKIEFFFISSGGNLVTVRSNTPRKADITVWHKVSMRVQDSEKIIRFYVDDKMVDVQKFDYKIISIPSNSELRLSQAFEPAMEGTTEITNRYVGVLQDVKFTLGSSNDCKSVTPCKCPLVGGGGCYIDGRTYSDGQQWDKDKCNVCKCKGNHVICIHKCPVCRDADKIYLHGDRWHPSNDSCKDCTCESGKTKCSPPTCPKLDCNKAGYSGQTVTLKGECCPICKEDQCKKSNKVYSLCGCTKTCSNHHKSSPCSNKCSEGCFCPSSQVMGDDGKCMAPTKCMCTVNGRTLKPGQFHSPNPCKFCICLLGYMHCSKMC